MTDDPIHAFLGDYAAAVLERDLARFLDLYAQDVQVFDSWDRWHYAGREDWGGMIAAWFDGIRDVRVNLSLRRLRPGLEPLIPGDDLSRAPRSGGSRSEALRDLRKSELVGAGQMSPAVCRRRCDAPRP